MPRSTPYALRWFWLCLPAMLALPAQATDVDVDTTISGVTSNNGGAVYNFGVSTPNLMLIITNGGVLTNVNTGVIGANAATNTSATVTGTGSAWHLSSTLSVGSSSSGNRLTISNGGLVSDTGATIGNGSRNTVTVTGAGSLWINTGSLTHGNSGTGNGLIISAGGKVTVNGNVDMATYSSGSSGHYVLVTGTNSELTLTGTFDIWRMPGSYLFISSGGVVRAASYTQSDSVGNGTTVDGAGSLFELSGQLNVAAKQAGPATSHYLMITNGGAAKTASCVIGNTGSEGYNNSVTVTGPGSVWTNTGSITIYGTYGNRLTVVNNGQAVGATSLSVGNGAGANYSCNSARVADGGLLEVGSSLTAGQAGSTNNTVTNQAGILQFTTASPTITIGPNTGNRIAMDGGTLSYRNATGVDLNANTNAAGVGLFTWTGTNTLRLDNSAGTNSAAMPYVFAGNRGPTNYAGLELINGTTSVKGSSGLAVDSTGSILFSNTLATIHGAFTNGGVMTITNSTVTCNAGCTLSDGATVYWHGTNSIVHVNGTLTLTGMKTFHVNGVPLEILPMTLFTSTAISDSGGWLVYPGQYRVTRLGTTLRLSRTSGTVVVVR